MVIEYGKWTEWKDLGIKVIEEKAEEEILKKVDKAFYYEAKVLSVSTNYFTDEVEIILEEGKAGEGDTRCFFTGCIKAEFNFWPSHPKSVPYRDHNCWIHWFFISKVIVTVIKENFTDTYYECKLDLFPLDVKLWCKKIQFSRVFKDGTSIEI